MLEIEGHTRLAKIIALLLIVSLILFIIPFPVAVVQAPVEQGVDQVVNSLDQVDGQDNFIPGKRVGQSTAQKVLSAFGGDQAQKVLESREAK